MVRKPSRQLRASLVRTFVFGVEDSIVSTVGLLSGIAVGGVAQSQIILTGVVLVFVEAFSMAVGSAISEESVEEYLNHKEAPTGRTALEAATMFFTYLLSGLIPLGPYILAQSPNALQFSVAASLAALLILGVVSAALFNVNIIRNGVRTLTLGGLAIFVGVAAALWLSK